MRALTAIVILCAAQAADAITFSFPSRPPPQLRLQVGSAGSTVDVVQFDVTPGAAESGNRVPGNQSILVYAHMRALPPSRQEAVLSADSSAPLTGPQGSIPMTQICWEPGAFSEGEIAQGCFDGSPSQALATIVNQPGRDLTGFYLYLDFFYANSLSLAPGTYTGRVTYTLNAP